MYVFTESPIYPQTLKHSIAYITKFMHSLEYGEDTVSYELLDTLAKLKCYVDIVIESEDISLELKDTPIRNVRMKGDLIELRIGTLTVNIADLNDIQSLNIPKPSDLSESLATLMTYVDTTEKHRALKAKILHYQNIRETFLF